MPLLPAISQQARRTISEFVAQDLANTAWAFSVLMVQHVPLLDSISAESRRKISDFVPQNLANTAWSYYELELADVPMVMVIFESTVKSIANMEIQPLANLCERGLPIQEVAEGRLRELAASFYPALPSSLEPRAWDFYAEQVSAF